MMPTYAQFCANPNKVNEFGVPLPACNGYRCDEHYWARIAAIRALKETT